MPASRSQSQYVAASAWLQYIRSAVEIRNARVGRVSNGRKKQATRDQPRADSLEERLLLLHRQMNQRKERNHRIKGSLGELDRCNVGADECGRRDQAPRPSNLNVRHIDSGDIEALCQEARRGYPIATADIEHPRRRLEPGKEMRFKPQRIPEVSVPNIVAIRGGNMVVAATDDVLRLMGREGAIHLQIVGKRPPRHGSVSSALDHPRRPLALAVQSRPRRLGILMNGTCGRIALRTAIRQRCLLPHLEVVTVLTLDRLRHLSRNYHRAEATAPRVTRLRIRSRESR
jgi:hypothetical protein